MNLKRPMYGPTHRLGPTIGKDVEIAKFGLMRYENDFFPKPKGGFDQVANQKFSDAVKTLQRIENISPTSGNVGGATWDVIWQYLDAYRRWQYRMWSVPPPPPTEEEKAFSRLLTAMQFMSDHTPGYLLGGGHGIPLSEVSAFQRLDCSSSTSKALYEAGLFKGEYAIVSGQFESWGLEGQGKFFTVYANSHHVFIRLHKSRWWRFDTSPHGDGGRGPKLRLLPRFTSGFVARHYEGM